MALTAGNSGNNAFKVRAFRASKPWSFSSSPSFIKILTLNFRIKRSPWQFGLLT
jgi:hypothetical protein